MKKLELKTKILTGALTGGILISSVSMAFAGTPTTASEKNGNIISKKEFRAPVHMNNEKKYEQIQKVLESVLKDSVASQTITQDESNKVLEYIKSKSNEAKNFNENSKVKKDKNIENKSNDKIRVGIFEELVEKGILTKEKADAVKVKMDNNMEVARDKELKEKLAKLVEKKTITQDQLDKILSAIKEESNIRKSDFEKMKNMTEEQRKEYIKTIKSQHKDLIKGIVESGVITEAQEKSVREVLPMKNGRDSKGKGGHFKQKNANQQESNQKGDLNTQS
ncbi:hypothetical protein RBU49_14230 [Clostridium sp. MB40-C1]|uniref:hypothetical protein n=1 Tax=Clostridium sp. MB40-C1 TaxID=3070996 RepID=UPI0027DEDAE5|nr:hypothetical protein [Clostridium sp. MB40-C1]WMJ80007.1 hypothetical protein RBU49_14230 [Clostridium sp. MB40-C1]